MNALTEVEGPRQSGEGRVLLEDDDDLTAQTSWAAAGYTVERFLAPALCDTLRIGIRQHVFRVMNELGMRVKSHESLERYHVLIEHQRHLHGALVRQLNKIPFTRLPVSPPLIAERISDVCGIPLSLVNPHEGVPTPWASVFGIRIVRPRSTDHNPLHKDAWLPWLRNAVNLYVPIAGSNERSSLCLVPGSHRWSEADIERTSSGAVVNGRHYTVPRLTSARRPLAIIRPNPAQNEVLVFSPYLIHGGAVNLNPDITRVSLELRLWRRH